MKTKIIFMMIMLSIIFNNCSKPADTKPAPAAPTADFTFSGANIPAPSTVAFSNASTNATSYAWDFGDGQTSTQKDPTHIFLNAGTFNVKLTATGDGGSISVTKSITIGAAPIADFSYTGANQHAPAIVNFTNLSVNATTYTWDFGDNQTSTLTSPSHQYTTGGVFTVKLTATGNGVNSVSTKTVNIGAAYTSVKINSISVSNLPFINPATSTGWNSSGGPNVYFKIEDVNSTVLLNASTNKINGVTQAMLPISWNFTTPYVINDLTKAIYFNFYNYNSFSSDDNMSYVGFLMTNYTSGSSPYPTTITVTQNGWTATLSVTWQ